MNKIILVNKEKGYTSRDVVNIIGKKFNTRKVGHFGTLDPLATGLLVIGTDAYTKLGNYLESDTKEYVAEVLVGVSTDTYDVTGNVLERKDDFCLDKDSLIFAVNSFKKSYLQEVPIYSAVKVNGRKLYEYARSGEKVELPKKEVTIKEIELLDIYERDGNKYFSFSCFVSKGTYIRSLINDISKEINIPLCMSNLCRTKQDKFSLCDASSLLDIENDNYKTFDIRDVLEVYEMEIPSSLEKLIMNGSVIDRIGEGLVLFVKDGDDIVLYGPYKDKMKPYLFFKKS